MKTTARVLVLGGRGVLGRRTMEAFARLPGVEVAAGSRRGAVRLDLNRPATLEALDDFDVVVNCSDTLRAPPDEAMRRCVARGRCFVEAGGHAPTIERLLAMPADGRGAAIVGAGLFPGVSNLLARKVLDGSGAGGVAVGILVSPLSGAGGGVAALMGDSMTATATRWRGGRREPLAPLAAGPLLPFGERRRRSYAASLPEVAMLVASTGEAADISAWVASNPPALAPLMRLSALMARGPRWWRRLVGAGTRLSMRLLRAGLLRGRRGYVELTARSGDHVATLAFPDGMRAAGAALAAAVAGLRERPPSPGVHVPDQVLFLDDQLDRMRALGVEVRSL